MEMTPKELKRICRELQLYSTPELNDKIYLHYKGFKKIENLEEFTGLKVIYLEGNGLTKIEGLDKMTQLRCLYLQENNISAIENLSALVELDSLNLNQNALKSLSGLPPQLTKLNTLLVQSNLLESLEDLKPLANCPSIGVLDLSRNKIDCAPDCENPGEELLTFLAGALPNLKVLYLKGNPIVERIPNYRKRVISALPTLTYLDDRPVFEDERRTCDAWARGGKAAEQLERQAIEDEKRGREKRNYEAFDKMMEDARKEAASAAASGAGSAVRGGRIEEEKESAADALEDAASAKRIADAENADSDDDEEKDHASTASAASAVPALEDESIAAVEHLIRPTSKISVTHSSAPAASVSAATASSSQPLLSLTKVTPASMANAAAAGGSAAAAGSKKMLIEMVDDEEQEEKVPDAKAIQQLD